MFIHTRNNAEGNSSWLSSRMGCQMMTCNKLITVTLFSFSYFFFTRVTRHISVTFDAHCHAGHDDALRPVVYQLHETLSCYNCSESLSRTIPITYYPCPERPHFKGRPAVPRWRPLFGRGRRTVLGTCSAWLAGPPCPPWGRAPATARLLSIAGTPRGWFVTHRPSM